MGDGAGVGGVGGCGGLGGVAIGDEMRWEWELYTSFVYGHRWTI